MLSFFRQGMRVWAVWTLGITGLLFFNPVGRFGWVELAACLGPLVLAADQRVRREVAFAVGLPAITLLSLLDSSDGSVLRLVTAWLVFAVGVLLIARVIEGRVELESIAGRVAFMPVDEGSIPGFKNALEREVGRARRHEKKFVVLSIAADPHSLANDQLAAVRSEVLADLATRRANFEIHATLVDVLHIYADVARLRDSVLALVPEVELESAEPLVARLRESIRDRLGLEIQVGLASFPNDAISAEDLILMAERARKTSNLRPIPDQDPSKFQDELPELASESQG